MPLSDLEGKVRGHACAEIEMRACLKIEYVYDTSFKRTHCVMRNSPRDEIVEFSRVGVAGECEI